MWFNQTFHATEPIVATDGYLSSPRRLLQLRCAGLSSLVGSPGTTWSAVHGSLTRGPSPQIQQRSALALTSRDLAG